MPKKTIVLILLLLLSILSACNNPDDNQPSRIIDASTNQSENIVGNAQILTVHPDLEKKNGWFIVPKGVGTMTISAEVENVETLLFWITPTGTEVWGERTLIGYDIDGSDGWSFEWEFDDRIFHDHITVQALGSDGATQTQETFNVHSVDESSGE